MRKPTLKKNLLYSVSHGALLSINYLNNSATLLDECFRVAGRQTWYITPSEIQRDLDAFLRYYNLEPSHQGYRLKGRTPAQALREALAIDALPPIVPEQEVTTEIQPDTLAA